MYLAWWMWVLLVEVTLSLICNFNFRQMLYIHAADRGYFGNSGATLAAKNNKICRCGMGKQLKVDMPILTCIFFTFNCLTLTSKMHFMKFYPEVASCLLSRGKRKDAPLGMRLL